MHNPIPALSLQEICSLTQGQLVSTKNTQIKGVCSLDDPAPELLAFSKQLEVKKLNQLAIEAKVGALLINAKINQSELTPEANFILVPDTLSAFVKIIRHFHPQHNRPKVISPRAEISTTASIGQNVEIGAFAVIGENVVIEDDVTIHPQVVIYSDVRIERGATIHAGVIIREGCCVGAGSIIHCGTVIGADGFGFITEKDEKTGVPKIVKVPQVGIVKIGKLVEIGANACIDRATLGLTRIEDQVKIDNLVQIGHNVTVGQQSILCGQVGIAGSTKLGKGVVMGGGSGAKDHVTITDGCRIAAGAGVLTDLTISGDYAGFPAVPIKQWRRQIVRELKVGRSALKKKTDA